MAVFELELELFAPFELWDDLALLYRFFRKYVGSFGLDRVGKPGGTVGTLDKVGAIVGVGTGCGGRRKGGTTTGARVAAIGGCGGRTKNGGMTTGASVAAGAGANIALACDIVLAARSASFIQAFCKIGLVPDSGGTYFLPRLAGTARAMGLALLGDKLSADQAEQWGLIWKTVDDDQLQAECI